MDRLGMVIDPQVADAVDSFAVLGSRTCAFDDQRAADCCPRRSPPAACPASSAAINFSTSGPSDCTYARAISSTTPAPARMFLCAANPAPVRWPAHSRQCAPVNAAARPSAATIPSCRSSRSPSSFTRPNDFVRPEPAFEFVEGVRPVCSYGGCLCRHRTDTCSRPGNDRSHNWVLRLHGYTDPSLSRRRRSRRFRVASSFALIVLSGGGYYDADALRNSMMTSATPGGSRTVR
jgi:hypothetical protein